MAWLRVALFALPLTLALPVAAGDEPDVDIVPQRSTRAGQGVAGIEGLRATFVVKAPPAEVLEALWDVRRFPEIFPDIEKLTVLERAPRRIDVAFRVDAVLAKVGYTLRRTLDRERGAIEWREIAGDLKHVRGAWRVKPTRDPGAARVTYESFVEVGAFVPTGLYRDLAMGKVREMAARVRKACE